MESFNKFSMKPLARPSQLHVFNIKGFTVSDILLHLQHEVFMHEFCAFRKKLLNIFKLFVSERTSNLS